MRICHPLNNSQLHLMWEHVQMFLFLGLGLIIVGLLLTTCTYYLIVLCDQQGTHYGTIPVLEGDLVEIFFLFMLYNVHWWNISKVRVEIFVHLWYNINFSEFYIFMLKGYFSFVLNIDWYKKQWSINNTATGSLFILCDLLWCTDPVFHANKEETCFNGHFLSMFYITFT